MGLFDQFPYTNFHELNLDWILRTLKELEHNIEQFVEINALKYADPIQWNITSQYEKNTIVIDPQTGTAYISLQPIPAGVSLSNTDYWTPIFDLSTFVIRVAKNFTSHWEPDTTLTATFNTSVGDWLVRGDSLYKVINNINAGDSYVIDSNIERLTVEEAISEAMNDISILNKYYLSHYKTPDITDLEALNLALSNVDTVLIDYDTTFATDSIITASGVDIRNINGSVATIDNLKIIGDNNNFDIVARFDNNRGLTLEGDNLTVRGKIYRSEKIVATETNYYNSALTITGDNCTVELETYNSHVGIIIGNYSHNIAIKNCYIHDHYTGIIIAEFSENCSVINSNIKNIDVNRSSGADGILIQCYTKHMLIDGNWVDNVSEHGMYLQCSESIISNNHVTGATGDGIKLASYDERLTGYYNLNSKIVNNFTDNNGGIGIRIQNVCVGTIISDNNCDGIRIVNVIGANYNPSHHITIANNMVDGDIYGVLDGGNIIQGNRSGRIEITPQSSSSDGCIISDNITTHITVGNYIGGKITNNIIDYVGVISGTWELLFNDIKAQASVIPIDKVQKIVGNNVVFTGDGQFNSTYPLSVALEFIDNNIDSTQSTKTPLQAPNTNDVKGSKIIGNSFDKSGEDVFLVNFYAADSIIQNNVGKCLNTIMFRPQSAYATVDTNLRITI